MTPPTEDLDAFLTTVELKLRGPFSSLELAKTLQSVLLRRQSSSTAELSEVEFVKRLGAVLHRTDKITQLGIIIGLLGFEPGEADEPIRALLAQAQEIPTYEEWVRVVAGLVQGIMFHNDDEDDYENDDEFADDNDRDIYTGISARRACFGEEARELLEKTCQAILDDVVTLEELTTNTTRQRGDADADPLFAPYRYALLNAELLQRVMPEIGQNDHFTVNHDADILRMDARLEAAKAEEEEQRKISVASRQQQSTMKPSNVKTSTPDTPNFPGFRSSNKNPATNRSAALPGRSSSLFITSKKPLPAAQTNLHMRRAGAAQALVGKGRERHLPSSSLLSSKTSAVGGGAGIRGRAMQQNARSRMKVIDAQEAEGLVKEHDTPPVEVKKKWGKPGRPTNAAKKVTDDKDGVAVGMKRKSEETQTLVGSKLTTSAITAQDTDAEESPNTRNNNDGDNPLHTNDAPGPHGVSANALATAALAAYQAQSGTTGHTPGGTGPGNATDHAVSGAAHHHGVKQQDWREMLAAKSNKLSGEDRLRVQQFFVEHINPTPDQSTYKLKLHEERTSDPATGQPVKETYYLELDYTNFTSKQSKKIKRY